MTKKNIYRQCGLRRELGNDRSAQMVSYLPIQFAKPHQIVRLKNANDQWEDGWKVVSVGQSVDTEGLPNSHQQIKSHRKRTGDSLRR
ncbi:MAG: hypothetical protein AB8B55_08700 [Mariniblastus sp.]